MKNEPEKIYLVVGADGECEDFEELVGVSWCENRINDDDLEYLSLNFISRRIKELEEELVYEDSTFDRNIINIQINTLKNLIK